MGARVLLVEDDDAIRETVGEVLNERGYEVVEARNGKEAIDWLNNRPEARETCLILLDMMMPVMSGSEFMQALRSCDVVASIPVAVISGYPHPEVPESPQVVRVLPKPFNLDALLDLVGAHCT